MLGKNNTLYWKLTITFLLILIGIGCIYVVVTANTAKNYIQEVNQKLYGGIAEQTVKEVKPFVDGGIDTSAIQDIMHSMMVINPSVEVYLLDEEGEIVTYVAPYKKVKLERIDLAPIKTFIAEKGENFICAEDPRNPGKEKVFSAAPFIEDGKTIGYAYVILAGEKQEDASAVLLGSFFLKSGLKLFLISLIAALIIGALAIFFLTKNLRNIIEVFKDFQKGNYKARINEKSKGDLRILEDTFNEMANKINDNIDHMQSVDHFRKELIANVSHDLRTPLSVIKGYIETLIMKGDSLSDVDRNKFLKTAFKSSKDLSILIDQLFEYSKLEANQYLPKKEPFKIDELVQDIYMQYELQIDENNIDFHIGIDEKLPLVYADISMVERVLKNLLDNAFKYTERGGRIALQLNDQNDGVEVRIVDNGIGISPDDQKLIFERFSQQNKSKKGAGLGLAIVKKILDLHNVEIKVLSEPQKGSSFYFTLPQVV